VTITLDQNDCDRGQKRRVRASTLEKALGLTLNLQFALMPDTSQPGDQIAVFAGERVSFVIRPCPES